MEFKGAHFTFTEMKAKLYAVILKNLQERRSLELLEY